MKLDTPYTSRPSWEQAQEYQCMKFVLRDATLPVRGTVFEAFGGIGMTASLIHELWPSAVIESCEISEECAGQYRQREIPSATIHVQDCREVLRSGLRFDAASLDFNRFTLLDLERPSGAFHREVLTAVFAGSPRWVQLTDSAINKLHLNAYAYGMKTSFREEYTELLSAAFRQRCGYSVVAMASHRGASYYRLERV